MYTSSLPPALQADLDGRLEGRLQSHPHPNSLRTTRPSDRNDVPCSTNTVVLLTIVPSSQRQILRQTWAFLQ